MGANGCGKTSLLRLITGSILPDSGSLEVADTVQFNYVDQKRIQLNENLTVLEEIGENKEFISLGSERISIWGYLKRFLFEDERINTQIKYLSGGEKARLILAKILRHGGNFLILDEPTNDLDLSSLRILEEALIHYPSSLIVVSHDRYFLNRVCGQIIAFENTDSPVISLGDYDNYLEKRRLRENALNNVEQSKKEKVKNENVPAKKAVLKKLSYMEERELAQLENSIPEAELKVMEIEEEFSDSTLFAERPKDVPAVQEALRKAKEHLDALYARWEELEAKKEALTQNENQ